MIALVVCEIDKGIRDFSKLEVNFLIAREVLSSLISVLFIPGRDLHALVNGLKVLVMCRIDTSGR